MAEIEAALRAAVAKATERFEKSFLTGDGTRFCYEYGEEMFFDYKGWRCQLRDIKIKIRGPVVGAGQVLRSPHQFEPYTKTENWFYHFCYHGDPNKVLAKHKGKCESHRPNKTGWSIRTDKDGHQYQLYWCQRCGAEAPFEVLDYFAKALELWRLADPNR